MPTTDSYISFLPYLRQGLAGSLTTPDTLGAGTSDELERAAVTLKYDVKATPISGSDVLIAQTREIKLTGPGDIIGISSKAIVSVSPKDWETNFEPNYIPTMEFYDEDFPWRYTPAAPKNGDVSESTDNTDTSSYRLRPWITLIALEETEFDFDTAFNGVLPSIKLKLSAQECLPNEQQTWAWAHVHVNSELGDNSEVGVNDMLTNLKNIVSSSPDKAISRLMCGRRLKSNTSYYLLLIPTFELGRLAGLGDPLTDVELLEPAWHWEDPAVDIHFPYYYKSYFKTGNSGDFESLARDLEPGGITETVGTRKMDIQMPGDATLELVAPVPTLLLEGVVKPADVVSDTWTIPDETNDFIAGLGVILNAPSELLNSGNADPLIGPPIYGRWHAERTSLNDQDSDWLHRVNLDPRYRVFAGLGTEVVRANQEEFMTIAWQQIGDVLEANRLLIGLQLAQETATKLFKRHFLNQPEELLLTLTGNAHARIVDPQSLPISTVYKLIRNSLVPTEIFSAAFRRLYSPRGQFGRRINTSTSQPFSDYSLLANFNDLTIVAAPEYVFPIGQISLTAIAQTEMTISYTQSQPARANFSLTSPNNSALSVTSTGNDSASAIAFRSAAISFHAYVSSIQPPPSLNPSLDIPNASSVLETTLEPTIVFEAMASQVTLIGADASISSPATTDVIMAAPAIRKAMYRYLVQQSPDWMVPGLNDLLQNSVSIFEINQQIIEAYMLGLNHEFARELLWRGYPTDQRGTYFSHFWDFVDSTQNTSQPNDYSPLSDIKPIHLWKTGNNLSDLGDNTGRTTPPENLLIVAVRGDLLKKYPNTVVGMQKAKWQDETNWAILPRELDTTAGSVKTPLFTAKINPDILFFGFDISAATAKGIDEDPDEPGWFFVLNERAGEIRFGLDVATLPASNPFLWNDLQWGHFITSLDSYPYLDTNFTFNSISLFANQDSIVWGRNSADIAYATMQLPVKLALHAKDLLQ